MLAVVAPAPLVVYAHVPDAALADAARALTEVGHIPGLTSGRGPDAVADFLSVLAHADTGYAAKRSGAISVFGRRIRGAASGRSERAACRGGWAPSAGPEVRNFGRCTGADS